MQSEVYLERYFIIHFCAAYTSAYYAWYPWSCRCLLCTTPLSEFPTAIYTSLLALYSVCCEREIEDHSRLQQITSVSVDINELFHISPVDCSNQLPQWHTSMSEYISAVFRGSLQLLVDSIVVFVVRSIFFSFSVLDLAYSYIWPCRTLTEHNTWLLLNSRCASCTDIIHHSFIFMVKASSTNIYNTGLHFIHL